VRHHGKRQQRDAPSHCVGTLQPRHKHFAANLAIGDCRVLRKGQIIAMVKLAFGDKSMVFKSCVYSIQVSPFDQVLEFAWALLCNG
jgi:hypothetical protein